MKNASLKAKQFENNNRKEKPLIIGLPNIFEIFSKEHFNFKNRTTPPNDHLTSEKKTCQNRCLFVK